MKFTQCVADTEEVLVGLSEIAKIVFTKDEFSSFEDDFAISGKEEDFYLLKGKELDISVHFEKYEGYFFSIIGDGEYFEKSKNYLSRCD